VLNLKRQVRLCINRRGDEAAAPGLDRNGYAGVPSMAGVGVFVELVVCCRGEADATTGYFLDIKVIDRAVREAALPVLEHAISSGQPDDPVAVLHALMPPLNDALGGVLSSVRWNLTPFYSVEATMSDTQAVRPKALIRQRFEFAAAHRLHAAGLSDAQNAEMFGKCNHINGHGHNYVFEPAVEVEAGAAFNVQALERVADTVIMARFDHKFLNLDCPEFRQPAHPGDPATGVNPSVENIARVMYDLLAPHISAHGGALRSIRVWETEKTSAEYPA